MSETIYDLCVKARQEGRCTDYDLLSCHEKQLCTKGIRCELLQKLIEENWKKEGKNADSGN